VAVGSVQVVTAVQSPASLSKERPRGVPEMVGFSLSVTMTLKVEVTLFPEVSVAV